MITISKNSKKNAWQYVDQRDTSIDMSPKIGIAKAIETGLITDIAPVTIIGQGKEALVFYGLDEYERWVAVKMYKLYNSSHRQALLHTPFTHPYDVMKEFPNREFSILKALHAKKILVPTPYLLNEFGYSMGFIGDDLGPAPLLSNVNKRLIIDASDLLEQCIDILQDMFTKANVVHGDFSEHNLLYFEEQVYVIDFLQASKFRLDDHVTGGSNSIGLSRAYNTLKKDIGSLLLYFEKAFRVYADFSEVLEYCVGDIGKKIEKSAEIHKESELSQKLLSTSQ